MSEKLGERFGVVLSFPVVEAAMESEGEEVDGLQ